MTEEKQISRRGFLGLLGCAAGMAAVLPQTRILEKVIPGVAIEGATGRRSVGAVDSFGIRVSQELLDDAVIDLPAVFLPGNWADAEMLGRPEGEDTLFGYPIIWTEQIEE